MLKSRELPDCFYYPNQPTLIPPTTPTPRHSLYLSNLDDQKFLRFTIKYLYLYSKSVSATSLKLSLSRVLVDYYPLAGRLRAAGGEDLQDHKLEVDCNGEGAIFAEGFMDISAQEMLEASRRPDRSWRKLLYRVPAPSFLDVPPLVVQVTNLRCGGMILCTAINHCLCDGIGTSQFLQAWAYLTTKPDHDLPVPPFHSRHLLRARDPPRVTHSHAGYSSRTHLGHVDITKYLQSQPLAPAALTFTRSLILRLKRRCAPSVKCTAFEALASHTWRCWTRSLDLPPSLTVKLLFSVNVRRKAKLPEGYYGNGFVLACAESTVKELVAGNIHCGVKLVQEAKSRVNDDYVRSVVDLLEDKGVKTDLATSFVISQWAKLGLEDLDFGEGKPMHMASLTSDIYCLFLPVAGIWDAVRVLVSMPESVVGKFEYYMTEFLEDEREEGDGDGESDGVDGLHLGGQEQNGFF